MPFSILNNLILTTHEKLFNQIYLFMEKKNILITKINIPIYNNKYMMTGQIDFIDDDDDIYELKCSGDITLKHVVQQILYIILHNKLYDHPRKNHKLELHFINLIIGHITNIKIKLTKTKILKIIDIFLKNKINNT